MSTEIKAILNTIMNPSTGKSLAEEGRVLDIKLEQNELLFKYKRDGITPDGKKIIESEIYQKVAGQFKPEQVTILTTSENSNDVLKGLNSESAAPAKPAAAPAAQIKAGHGPVGSNKKVVANVKKVIAVSSCKGGVGKSTVAVNLAFALKNLGKKVGILDADIYGPSMPMLLNQRDTKPSANDNKKIIPVDAYGISFISFGLFIGESEPVIWRGPMLGGVLNQFLFDVEWATPESPLDYLIIDLPPGTGDMQLSMVQSTDIDGAVVVSTPQAIAVLDSKKGLQMFNQVKIPVIGMIENMSYFVPEDNLSKKYYIFGQGGVAKAAEELNVPHLAEIPLETAIREGSDNGTPYMNEKSFEGRPVWEAYMGLAKKIDTKFYPEEKGFFKKLFS